MKVYINGAPLDMGTEGATIQKKTYFAEGEFADAFSQRLTIPLTTNNMQLLDIYAPMERAWGQTTGADIQVDGWNVPIKGRLEVNALNMQEQTAEVTVYTSNALNALADKKLRDLVADTPATLVEWRSGGGNISTGIYAYYRGATNSWAHPSVSLSWLWQQIAAATGATLPALPTVAANWRVLCTGRRASVREYRQLVQTKWAAGGSFSTDYSSASYYGTADGGQVIIGYSGTVSFYGAGNNTQVSLQLVRAGSVVSTTTYRTATTSWAVQRGDIIRMGSAATTSTDSYLPLMLTHAPQTLADDDGRELGAWQPYANPQYGAGFTSWVWGWFPVWRNLPDISLRDLLSSVAILTGRRLVEGAYWDAAAPALAPVDDDEAVVETLEKSDRLTGRNLIVAEDGTAAPVVHAIPTTGGESTFLTIKGLYAAREHAYVAYVQQYKDGGGTTAASFTEVKGAPILSTDGVSWSLLATPALPDLLAGVNRATEATIYSSADLRNAERIRVRGHVFLITEKDFNEDTQTWEIHAILQ